MDTVFGLLHECPIDSRRWTSRFLRNWAAAYNSVCPNWTAHDANWESTPDGDIMSGWDAHHTTNGSVVKHDISATNGSDGSTEQRANGRVHG